MLAESSPRAYFEHVARVDRDHRLRISDWTQMPDSPLSTQQKAEWATYRQQLRDITTQSMFPYEIDWPVAPI